MSWTSLRLNPDAGKEILAKHYNSMVKRADRLANERYWGRLSYLGKDKMPFDSAKRFLETNPRQMQNTWYYEDHSKRSHSHVGGASAQASNQVGSTPLQRRFAKTANLDEELRQAEIQVRRRISTDFEKYAKRRESEMQTVPRYRRVTDKMKV